jgi:hypothetical protein
MKIIFPLPPKWRTRAGLAVTDKILKSALTMPALADEMHSGNPGELRKILSELNIEAPAPVNYDNYYAILMMDGDKMGKLVAMAKRLAANWQSDHAPGYPKNAWKMNQFSKQIPGILATNIFKEIPKRHVTPAIHAAISEALGDFALNGVFPIIKRHRWEAGLCRW